MHNVGAFKNFHYTQETWHSNSSHFYIPVTIYIRPVVYTNGIVQNMGASWRGRQYNDAAFLWLLCMKLQQLSIAFRFPQSAISVYKAIPISEKQLGLWILSGNATKKIPHYYTKLWGLEDLYFVANVATFTKQQSSERIDESKVMTAYQTFWFKAKNVVALWAYISF